MVDILPQCVVSYWTRLPQALRFCISWCLAILYIHFNLALLFASNPPEGYSVREARSIVRHLKLRRDPGHARLEYIKAHPLRYILVDGVGILCVVVMSVVMLGRRNPTIAPPSVAGIAIRQNPRPPSKLFLAYRMTATLICVGTLLLTLLFIADKTFLHPEVDHRYIYYLPTFCIDIWVLLSNAMHIWSNPKQTFPFIRQVLRGIVLLLLSWSLLPLLVAWISDEQQTELMAGFVRDDKLRLMRVGAWSNAWGMRWWICLALFVIDLYSYFMYNGSLEA